MSDSTDAVPRFTVNDAEDAEILAGMCERMAAGHIQKHTEPHNCVAPEQHLTLSNFFMDMAMDLREAGIFADTFSKTLDEISRL